MDPLLGGGGAGGGAWLDSLGERLSAYADLLTLGAAGGVAVALLVEAVPLISLSRTITLRQAFRFSTGTADPPGRMRWLGMTALSAVPPLCWASWLLAAQLERDGGLRAVYSLYAALYAAPLLLLTEGLGIGRVGPLAGAFWLACVLHVQLHRVLRTNGVL